MEESKIVSKRRKTQDLLQKYAIFTSHKLSLHTHSQSLIWQECQAKDEAPHLGTFFQLLGIIHPKVNEWNPTDKM